ncbi:unnamed protein product [Rangifer tarandus platyrhynchus]|uniref:Uncharacterized protein n=2 Tax=Rangifer tarandus platyrhynchus TaxID=3082113 RepID=A0ABN8XWS0_RANTA|nr:unnamed protein product [Rangifer tarandus platyrhynchus]CAI9713532.1 unnamed protein product [Rangifer tarandus platyrhynchus]
MLILAYAQGEQHRGLETVTGLGERKAQEEAEAPQPLAPTASARPRSAHPRRPARQKPRKRDPKFAALVALSEFTVLPLAPSWTCSEPESGGRPPPRALRRAPCPPGRSATRAGTYLPAGGGGQSARLGGGAGTGGAGQGALVTPRPRRRAGCPDARPGAAARAPPAPRRSPPGPAPRCAPRFRSQRLRPRDLVPSPRRGC